MATINVVSEGNIIPNLRADIMRKAMQPKGFLTHKGGIYVGTGTYTDDTAGTDVYRIYQTVEVFPQSGYTNGAPLVSDSSATGGLKFGNISGTHIIDKTIAVTKLVTTETTANKLLITNGGTTAPTFQNFKEDFIPNHILGANKLGLNICDTTVKTSTDGAISIQLGQDSDTRKIKINNISLDLSKVATLLDYTVVANNIRTFSLNNNILYIN